MAEEQIPVEEDDYEEDQARNDEEWDEAYMSRVIEELCISKAEEFRLLGYEQVTGADVWQCVSEPYIKTGMPRLHRIVNDILTLKITKFMNQMTLNAYKGIEF
ncbi:hypothetical protein XYCOK13_29570 [Xylanibacillus composti]|uniref:ComN-like post-transcriptional regulator n=1 Tax=Xylanibacillus composti TaxID=1572762 RepID=A0A8J4H7B6_9BACL|nr:post-transcriptional regulator [Xylanibacillus composti]GIQ70133.1 hypothetical protein XYCOK13_29570 [Xylanibacillus composti]